jgi:hypothetical protein
MEKKFIATVSLIILVTAFFATAKNNVAYKIISGSVKVVTLGDPSRGVLAEVMVVDEKSAENIFLVKSTTTLWSKEYKAIDLDKIKPNDRIKVKYVKTKEGLTEAVSINILK